MTHVLDNITWHSLTGPHAKYAAGTDDARRYATGFSPIVGFADVERPNFDALRPYCEVGEHFYREGWLGSAAHGWQIDAETTLFKMVWDAPLPAADEGFQASLLRAPEHAARAVELAILTQAGPFGVRTIELGEYFGCFDGKRLVAMAGERMFAGSFREISGVCTHPDFRGKGLARRLMVRLIRRQLLRSEKPFLRVMRDNSTAYETYRRLGFRVFRESVVRVVSAR
jgi:ribosomal protein S18 acetylase RimI-like enzyme